ncbi:extracellular solute-binding protein 3, partial [Tanacetum coccineum]
QIFTATLSSWLTLDQLRPRLPTSFENAGYQGGSFIKDLIIQRYNCSGERLMVLESYEDFKNALSNGSVNAVFDELPYIDIFLSKYGSEYMKFGPINQESGIAFAFAIDSPLLQTFSRAVINVAESKIMMDMKTKYLGFSNKPQPNQPLPQSLDVQSFIGLFIFMGIVTLGAIASSEHSLLRGQSKVVAEEQIEKQATQSELSQPIESTQRTHRTPSAPRPPNPQEQQGESSAKRKFTIIRIPKRKLPDPTTPILRAEQIDVDNLDEATRVSIATTRSIDDYEAQQAVKKC